jgi:hypothetical protein
MPKHDGYYGAAAHLMQADRRARNDRLIVAHSTSCYPRQTTWQCRSAS